MIFTVHKSFRALKEVLYMKTGISEQQELLLLKACQNDGQFSISLAEQLYSSKQSARSAVQKLEVLGYIENTAPGYFKVEKVTRDVREHLDDSKDKDGSGSDADGSKSEGSEFVKEPV
jgi:hypothetical protein